MKHYAEQTIHIISYAKLSENTPAGAIYKYMALGFIVNYQTGIIEDISCTILSPETQNFLKDCLVGYNLHEKSSRQLVAIIERRFYAASVRTISRLIRENCDKYAQVVKTITEENH